MVGGHGRYRDMTAGRTHLDLVPWLRTADETKVAAFLEELYAVSGGRTRR